MKILFITTLYSPNIVGGAERVVQDIATGLARMGCDTVVVTLWEGKYKKKSMLDNVTVYYLPVRNIYWPFQERRPSAVSRSIWHMLDSMNPLMSSSIESILNDEKPDVVNTHTLAGFSISVWSAAKRQGYPVVHTLHDQYLLCPRCTMYRHGRNCVRQCLSCRLFSLQRRAASKNADVVVGVSRFVLDRHTSNGYFPKARQCVIYNACEMIRTEVASHERTGREKKLRFGYLGRIDATKGLDHLLKEFGSMICDSAELWIAGTGRPSYETKLKHSTQGDRRIRWMGYVEPAELLSQIDVLVVPSLWHDTAPRTVQEALVYGLPVVATRRGGIPELLAGTGGLLYEPEQLGALRGLLDFLVRQFNEQKSSQKIDVRRRKKFARTKMLSRYIKLFQDARR